MAPRQIVRDTGVWSSQEYAESMLPKKPNGGYDCQCIVFSDGGRILGLGDSLSIL